jgi:two-component system response regulator RegX3
VVSKGTILVVEYYDTARESLAELLRGEGYDVYQAPDVNTATSLVDQLDLGLVLLTLADPGAFGFVERVQKTSARTAVIVMSDHDSERKAMEAIRLGACDYVLKPIVFGDLLAKVHALESFSFRR